MTYCKGMGGDPYVNLALAVLEQAKEDDENKYPINKNTYKPSRTRNKYSYVRMWRKFKKSGIYKRGVNGSLHSIEVACWVGNYITGEKNG